MNPPSNGPSPDVEEAEPSCPSVRPHHNYTVGLGIPCPCSHMYVSRMQHGHSTKHADDAQTPRRGQCCTLRGAGIKIMTFDSEQPAKSTCLNEDSQTQNGEQEQAVDKQVMV